MTFNALSLHASRQARPFPAWVAGAAMLLSSWAQAQALPDPGTYLNEQLRQIDRAAPRPSAPATPEVPPAREPVPADARTATITEIQFSRTELLEAQALQSLGQRYVGRALSSADLQALLDDIGQLYRERDIATAAAVLPQQDLQSGRLRVLLVEGRLGNVRVSAEGGADTGWVQQWFDLPAGEVVRSQTLRQRLVLFNNASDMSANAAFVPGQQFGVSDLVVEVPAPQRLQLWSFVESTRGEDATGQQRAVGLRLAPLGARGGRLDAAALATAAGHTLTASASLPIGAQGWRAGVSAAQSRTETRVAGSAPGDDLLLDGRSTAVSLDIGKTWVLSEPWLLSAGLTVGTLGSSTHIQDLELFRQRVNKVALHTLLNRDTGRARSLLRASVVDGRHQHQGFSYLELAGNHQSALDQGGRWQWRVGGLLRAAPGGLPPASERLQLGGLDTVRGHDSGAASGERGYALQLELRHRHEAEDGLGLETYAFWDHGRVQGAPIGARLASVGLGLQMRLGPHLGLDLLGSRQHTPSAGSRHRITARLVASW